MENLSRRKFLIGTATVVVAPALPPVPSPVFYPKLVQIRHNLTTNGHLFQQELWSKALKQALLDDLMSMKFKKIQED
jgi:hypothetical protein